MAISENILEAIYKSRKVIVVLSQNFMKSMWGQFELSQALNRAVMQVMFCQSQYDFTCSKTLVNFQRSR